MGRRPRLRARKDAAAGDGAHVMHVAARDEAQAGRKGSRTRAVHASGVFDGDDRAQRCDSVSAKESGGAWRRQAR